MHVNPAIIGAKSTGYHHNSSAQATENAARNRDVSAEKSAKEAEKSAHLASSPAEGQEKFSFWDLVDIINPLQHIPLVNTVYREITGDQINSFGRIAGGTIFGGFAGFALSGVNAIIKHDTGNDLGEMAMVKAGFRPDVKRHDEPLEMVPVIEKSGTRNTSAKNADERATLENIIWDAPSLLQVATKETIQWDAPSIAIVKQGVAVADNTQTKAPLAADKIPAHVTKEIPVNAYQMAAAMPDPQSLNDIEPGSPSSPLPDGMNVADVPNNMMQALAKYQSMQRFGGENAIAAQELRVVDSSGNTGRKFAKLEGKVRRY